MRTPEWWHVSGDRRTAWMVPLSMLYRLGRNVHRRFSRPQALALPAVCVGNVVAGGTGKTPVTLALAELLRPTLDVHVLSRGYGGRIGEPTRIQLSRHGFRAVGDEPLLLAKQAPTWIAADRHAGARAAQEAGAKALILDDGLQNPGLAPDVTLLVIDGRYGFGNGFLLPAGPMREPLHEALARTDAVVLLGEDTIGVRDILPPELPIFAATLRTVNPQDVEGHRVVAFAGLGRPEKFFSTLEAAGATIASRHPFADHHPFTLAEMTALENEARRYGAVLVTTAKDAVRVPEAYRGPITVLEVACRFEEPERLTDFVKERLRRGD